MATEMIATRLKIDEERVLEALQLAEEKLSSVNGEVTLDLSSVRRLDASALRALQSFAEAADAQGAKVLLLGVDIAVYKVLKLMKLKSRFSFAS
jgi:anti-anti-sigma regulatory factor